MKHYQDTETGQIYAFEDDVDPFKLKNRNIPTTLSETVIPRPSESHVWYEGDWIKESNAPKGYKPPVSSVPVYNPAWVAFLSPYTVILPRTDETWDVSLEQINTNSYDNERLSKAVASLPYSKSSIQSLVSFDGAIAIPMNAECPSDKTAINTLNHILCAILLGGIHVEVVSHQDLCSGSLHDKENIFVHHNLLQTRLRHKWASTSERIALTSPRVLSKSDLIKAHQDGMTTIATVKNFSPFFLLHGYTAMMHKNLSDALSSLWIVVEQLTWSIWDNQFMKVPEFHPSITMKSRKDSMKNDNRTWPISVKHELLWQTELLSDECYEALSLARNQRNNLVHRGSLPEASIIMGLWRGLSQLLQTASGISQIGMLQLTPIEIPDNGFPGNTNFDEWLELSKKLRT